MDRRVDPLAGLAAVRIKRNHRDSRARLASMAGAGEILISEFAQGATGSDLAHLERRRLTVNGHPQPVDMRVLRIPPRECADAA